MEKLTIIDGSSLIYSASFNCASKEDKTDDFSAYRDTLDYYIENILEVTQADKYIIFGDESSSYRKRLFGSFKADRKIKSQYTKFLYDLLHHAKDKWNIQLHPDLEADDMCLLCYPKVEGFYDCTIAAIDGDLRQYPAKFFNYGIFRKKDYQIEDGFEIITPEQANFNLWKQVLMKGHNNKLDYLDGCGDVCATNYLMKFRGDQYPYAVLKAYIDGIPKQEGIRSNIDGYGVNKGLDKLAKSFKQTYLFRYPYELTELGIDFTIPEFITRNKQDDTTF